MTTKEALKYRPNPSFGISEAHKKVSVGIGYANTMTKRKIDGVNRKFRKVLK